MRLNTGLSYCLSAIADGHLVTRIQLVLSLQCVKVMCAQGVINYNTFSTLRSVRLCVIICFLFFCFMFCSQNQSGQ